MQLKPCFCPLSSSAGAVLSQPFVPNVGNSSNALIFQMLLFGGKRACVRGRAGVGVAVERMGRLSGRLMLRWSLHRQQREPLSEKALKRNFYCSWEQVKPGCRTPCIPSICIRLPCCHASVLFLFVCVFDRQTQRDWVVALLLQVTTIATRLEAPTPSPPPPPPQVGIAPPPLVRAPSTSCCISNKVAICLSHSIRSIKTTYKTYKHHEIELHTSLRLSASESTKHATQPTRLSCCCRCCRAQRPT